MHLTEEDTTTIYQLCNVIAKINFEKCTRVKLSNYEHKHAFPFQVT